MDEATKEKLRSVELEILDEIVRICEKHDITYFLAYGTLLGAVRHDGFIPWDDDVDIAMPREEYERFKKVCVKKNELDGKYFLQNYETEPRYWHGISQIKVRKDGTLFEEPEIVNLEDLHKGIFVDIFVLDHASKEKSILQDIQAVLFEVLQGMMWHKIVVASQDTSSLKHKLVGSIASLFKVEHLSKLQEKVVSFNNDEDSRYYIHFGGRYGHRKKTIPKDVFHPPTKVEFEGESYNAPGDWDEYLTRIYGDYMELPPEDKRGSHNPQKIRVK